MPCRWTRLLFKGCAVAAAVLLGTLLVFSPWGAGLGAGGTDDEDYLSWSRRLSGSDIIPATTGGGGGSDSSTRSGKPAIEVSAEDTRSTLARRAGGGGGSGTHAAAAAAHDAYAAALSRWRAAPPPRSSNRTAATRVGNAWPSATLQRLLLSYPNESLVAPAALAASEPLYLMPRKFEEDVADLRRSVTAVERGPGYTLFCHRNATAIPIAFNNVQVSPPRCYLHRHACGRPGAFKVYAYPFMNVGPKARVLRDPRGEKKLKPLAGIFYRHLYAAFKKNLAEEYETAKADEACVFLLGVDTLMFGNNPGVFSNPGDHTEGDALLDAACPHARPPFKTWLGGRGLDGQAYARWAAAAVAAPATAAPPPAAAPAEEAGATAAPAPAAVRPRELWGLNHLSLGFFDWAIDAEKCFSSRGTLTVRSATNDVTYQKWVDLTVPLPKVVANKQRRTVPAADRPGLVFFSGSVYDFKSSRYALRQLRRHGTDAEMRVWLYCYDKTKGTIRKGMLKKGKKRLQPGFWDRFKVKCASETDRADADGFFPFFKKKKNPLERSGNLWMPPEVFTGRTADLYSVEMEGSTFCLVLRGWGLHSYRLTEALFFGCIPVIFQPGPMAPLRDDFTYIPKVVVQQVYPFAEKVDWDRVAITASEDVLYNQTALAGLVERMRAVKQNATLVSEMQQQGMLLHDRLLGGPDVPSSMHVMLSAVLGELRYRARLMSALVDADLHL